MKCKFNYNFLIFQLNTKFSSSCFSFKQVVHRNGALYMMAVHVTGQAIRGDQSRMNRFFALGKFNNAILPNRIVLYKIWQL